MGDIANLMLRPDILRYVQHSQNNLDDGTAVQHPNNSVSTVYGTIVNMDGKETLVPTVWDGEILEGDGLFRRLRQAGGEWPNAENVDAALAMEQAIKKNFINKQVQSGTNELGEYMGNLVNQYKQRAMRY